MSPEEQYRLTWCDGYYLCFKSMATCCYTAANLELLFHTLFSTISTKSVPLTRNVKRTPGPQVLPVCADHCRQSDVLSELTEQWNWTTWQSGYLEYRPPVFFILHCAVRPAFLQLLSPILLSTRIIPTNIARRLHRLFISAVVGLVPIGRYFAYKYVCINTMAKNLKGIPRNRVEP